MTINKVSRSGSSLVTLAELQSGSAVFVQKAARVTTAGPVISGGLVTQANIIKRGLQVPTLIGRATANPYGSIFTFFERLGLSDEAILLLARQVVLADQFFITHDAPTFLLGKVVNDSIPALEKITLRISAFRVFEDAQRMASAPKLTLLKPVADNQSLIDLARINVGYRRAAADIQGIIDTRTLISIGKGNQDTVTESDLLAKSLAIPRSDQTTVSELKSLTPGKAIFDGVTVRNHDDPGPALYVTKLLRDTTTMLDLTGVFDGVTYQTIMARFDTIGLDDSFSRTVNFNRTLLDSQSFADRIYFLRSFNRQDDATVADDKSLNTGLARSDNFDVTELLQRIFLAQRVFEDAAVIAEVRSFVASLGKQDTVNVNELIAKITGRLNSDSFVVNDAVRKSPTKKLVDSILSSEAMSRAIGKGLADRVTVTEEILALLIHFIRVNEEALMVDSRLRLTVDKSVADIIVGIEQNYKFIDKPAQDSLSSTDRPPVFAISKYLADSTIMLDLAAAFDGVTYNYGLNKTDSVTIVDASIFERIFLAARQFVDDVSITDTFSKVRSIGGFADRTDTATLSDRLIIGKIPFDTLYIGSAQDQRSRNEERISFNVVLPITTSYRTLIREVDFFTGYEEYLTADIPVGQSFAGSAIFASTSAGASVQVTSSGTGAGTTGGFATPFGPSYISFQGPGTRSLTTVPLDLTVVSSANITFSVIAGNNSNGGEQPDVGEDLVIEYSIDDGATFVTAATVYAVDTYAYSTWFQYSTSVPTAAITSSTLLRWRQTKQSLNNGDNYGITNFRLGSSSFGTYVNTYYDKNTANIAEKLSLGQYRSLADTQRMFPVGYTVPLQIFERWDQQALESTSPVYQLRAGSAVHSSSSGYWYVMSQNETSAIAVSTDGGINWSWSNAPTANYSAKWKVGANTSGQTLLCVASPINNINAYSFDGGVNWNSINPISGNDIVNPLDTQDLSVGKSPSNSNSRPLGVPLYSSGRNAFIYGYAKTSGGTTTAYGFMFSSSSPTTAPGVKWSIGGGFTDSVPPTGRGGDITWTGAAYGAGVMMYALNLGTANSSVGGDEALYYLSDGTALTSTFTRAVLAITSGSVTYSSSLPTTIPSLAFGNGRFIWASRNGWVVTTTSPTVTASWQFYRVSTSTYTGFGVFGSIAFDPVKSQFIIAQNGTSATTSGFWYSTSGAISSWVFKSAETLRRTDGQLQASAQLWPATKAVFSSGSTSIAQALTTFYSATTIRIGQLYTGSYIESQIPYENDIDRVSFGYGIQARQGVNRTFSGTTVTARDNERLFIGTQNLLQSIESSSITSVFVTNNYAGNLGRYSEDFSTGWNKAAGVTVQTDQTTAPDGTLTADLVTWPSNGYITQGTGATAFGNTTYRFSCYFKGVGSSIGRTIAMINDYDPSFGTSVVLTSEWQLGTFLSTKTFDLPGAMAIFGYGYFGANIQALDQVYLWGFQFTTGTGTYTTTSDPLYTRTTSTLLTAYTDSYTAVTTSYTYRYTEAIRPGLTDTQESVRFLITQSRTESVTASDAFTRITFGGRRIFEQLIVDDTISKLLINNRRVADSASTADRISKDVFKPIIESVGIGSNEDRRSAVTERTFFAIGKQFGDGVIPDDFLQTFDGLTYNSYKTIREFTAIGLGIAPRVSGSDLERIIFDVSMPMTRGVAGTVAVKTIDNPGNGAQSSVLLGFGARSPDWIGTLDLINVLIIKPVTASDFFTIGTDTGFRQTQGLETTKFTITKLAGSYVTTTTSNYTNTQPVQIGFGSGNSTGVRWSGSDLERTAFSIAIQAYRGTSGTITLNTIDPTPDVEFQQSSVTVGRGARSPDDVGMLDFFSLTYVVNRTITESISIGSGEDRRSAVTERTFFTIGKRIGDDVIPDDFLQTFDGLTYNGYKTLREVIPVGLNIGPRVSGSDLEKTLFDVSMDMRRGVAGTVAVKTIDSPGNNTQSSVLLAFGARSPDWIGTLDRISVIIIVPKTIQDFFTIGTDAGFRQTQGLETVKFLIGLRETETQSIGFGSGNSTGSRVSGDDLERTAFNITLLAKQSANWTVSGVTIAAAARGDTVRVGQRYGIIRFSRDAQEKIAFDYFKSLPAGSNNTVVITADRTRTSSLFVRGRAFTQEDQPILGQYEGNFRYTLTQRRTDSLQLSDFIAINKLLIRTIDDYPGILDPLGNINTMVSNGNLRMTDYTDDLDYFAETYIGESRSFT